TQKIADYAVSTKKLLGLSVTTPKIRDEAVTASKIGKHAVHEVHMADDAVSTRTIQDKAVTGGKIADDAVGYRAINPLVFSPVHLGNTHAYGDSTFHMYEQKSYDIGVQTPNTADVFASRASYERIGSRVFWTIDPM